MIRTQKNLLNLLHIPAILFSLSLICTSSCHRNLNRDDHFYEEVLKKAQQLFDKGKLRQSAKFTDSVFMALPPSNPIYQARRFQFKIKIAYAEGRLDSTRLYIDSQLYVLESNGLDKNYPADYSSALMSKSNIYFDANNLSKAFEYYYSSKLALPENKDTCMLSNLDYHLGMVTYRQEKYSEALGFFKQALRELMNCPEDTVRFIKTQEFYNDIALSYTHLSEWDSAMTYYNHALIFIDTANKIFPYTSLNRLTEMAKGVIYGNIAKIFIAQNHLDTAKQLLLKSIAINIKPGFENNDVKFSQMQLAELFFRFKDFKAMLGVMDTLKQEQAAEMNGIIEMRWQRLMFLYHKELKDPVTTLQYLENYLSLKDSADSADKKLKATDFPQLFKDQEVQYHVSLLEKDNQLERVSLAVSVGFSVMALLIIVLVYTNARKTRKNVKKLSALNLLINEQKDDLEKTSADLRQSNRDKDRILQVVAHDLRNPVSGIMMLGSFLLEDETDPVKKETLSVIINASQSSQALINELLEYSGNALFEQEGKKEIIDINELVKQAKGLLQFKADEKQQRISITLFPEPLYINVFKDKINRLLGNLITNSIKFSPVQSAIDLIVSRNGDNVVVEVKDNGIGIPEKQKDIIFEPFTTAKRPGTLGEKSFGLGLSICKQIIGVNKGRIWVESIEGKGSSFFIELPLTNL